jgi:P-type E1-E2 ATPase
METIAENAQRVLALAYKKTDDLMEISTESLGNDFIFLGFVGIIDPPREEALQAIKDCKKAGIRVIMITGDHAVTAKSISNQLGISEDGKVVTGRELQNMTDEDLKNIVMESNVCNGIVKL